MGLGGKIVVVTGGSRGIGLAAGRLFASRGARVVLVARSAEELRGAAESVRRQAPDPRGAVVAAAVDVTSERAVRGLFRKTSQELGRVDVLVNGAGVLVRGEIANVELEAWNRSLAANLTGVFLCSREAVRLMLRQEPDGDGLRGHLVQIVSGAGVHGWPGQGAYAAAKHGVMGLSATLRDEVRTQGIKVSDVLPGMVETAMTDIEDFSERAKLRPEDVAQAIVDVVDTAGRTMITRMDVRHRLPR